MGSGFESGQPESNKGLVEVNEMRHCGRVKSGHAMKYSLQLNVLASERRDKEGISSARESRITGMSSESAGT